MTLVDIIFAIALGAVLGITIAIIMGVCLVLYMLIEISLTEGEQSVDDG